MITNLKTIRKIVLVFLTHKIALPLLKIFRKYNHFPYEKRDLEKFPIGTLGHDLYLFLEKRNLPLLKYYARHDLKHILLGYDTNEAGEACLQCFMLGNGRISFPVLATVLYSFITMPEYHKMMKEAYRKGKDCTCIHSWKWNELIFCETSLLRQNIFCK